MWLNSTKSFDSCGQSPGKNRSGRIAGKALKRGEIRRGGPDSVTCYAGCAKRKTPGLLRALIDGT